MGILLAAQNNGYSVFSLVGMMVLMIAVMYFFVLRPQKKEQKRLSEMLSAMEVGDAVETTSGFYGVVIDISGDDVVVEFGSNKNCRIPMKKQAIFRVEKA